MGCFFYVLPALTETKLHGQLGSGLALSTGAPFHTNSESLASVPLFVHRREGQVRAHSTARSGGVARQHSASAGGHRWCYFPLRAAVYPRRCWCVAEWGAGIFMCPLRARCRLFKWQWGEGQVRYIEKCLSAWAAAGSCSPAAILTSPINILSSDLEGLSDNLVFMLVWTLSDYQLSLITQALPCLLGNSPDSTEGPLLLLPILPLPILLFLFWIAGGVACSLCCPPCAPNVRDQRT